VEVSKRRSLGSNPARRISKKIAVFDLDRTLLYGTSGEMQLVRFLRRKGLISQGRLILGLIKNLVHLARGIEALVLRKSYYLAGLDVETVRAELDEFFNRHLKPNFSRPLVEAFEQLRGAGYETYIVSGSLNFIVQLVARYLGADGGIGSEMEAKDGRYTGRIAGLHPYRHNKMPALSALVDTQRVDFGNSVAFGDAWADRHLLRLFGHPVAVNPLWLFRIRARRWGWRILETDAYIEHNPFCVFDFLS